jgi:hypothetical protein
VKPRHTIVLWGILLLLCTAYWWAIRSEQEALRVRQEASAVFPERQGGDLTRVTIDRPDEAAIVAERTASGWMITAPFEVEASPQVWNRIADSVLTIRNERTIDDPGDADLYGLDPARLRVTLDWVDGASQTLSYGLMEPTARYRYAQDAAGTLFLTNNEPFAELDRPLLDLRNRYLVGSGRERITRIAYTRIREPNDGETPTPDLPAELEGGVVQTTVVFEEDEEGLWLQIAPVPGLANQDKVDEFIAHVQFATGGDYNDSPAPLANYGMGPAPVRLEVWYAPDEPGGEERSQAVYFGAMADNQARSVFVKREGEDTVFAVDATTLGFFPDTPNAFLEHRLLTRGTVDLYRITYRHRGEEVVLQDMGDRGWRMVAPEEAGLDSVTFSNFVSYLAQVEGIGFPQGTPGQFGLEEDPFIEILLEYRGEAAPDGVQVIRIGQPDLTGENFYALSDRGAIIALPAAHAEALRKDAFYFREKNLMRFLPAAVRSVSMSFEGQRYEFVNVEGLWAVRYPEGLRWDSQADMRLILDSLANVRAVAVERGAGDDDATLERFGLAFPILSTEVFILAGEEVVTLGVLDIGDVAPEPAQSRYARSEGRPGIFQVNQAIVDDIRQALRGVVRAE